MLIASASSRMVMPGRARTSSSASGPGSIRRAGPFRRWAADGPVSAVGPARRLTRLVSGRQVFGFAGGEGVAAQDVQVAAHERGQPREVLIADRVALGPQLPERSVDVEGVPQHDEVQDQA